MTLTFRYHVSPLRVFTSSFMTPLPNYLRASRKRLALSQDEVAFLLGIQNGSAVCRYEQFERAPTLETALAFEAIFQRPARELFKGLYHKAEKAVASRAKILGDRQIGASKRINHRRQMLLNIAGQLPNQPSISHDPH